MDTQTVVALCDVLLVIIGIIGLVLIIFVNRKSHFNPYIVVINCENHESESAAVEFLRKQTSKCVIKGKTARAGNIEINAEIRMKDDNTDFINILSDMKGIGSAVLVSYNGEYMG